MKIKNLVLTSAFFPPSIGGPATFVSNIGPEFVKIGYEVSYVNLEPYKHTSKLKRMFLFTADFWRSIKYADIVLICDTWSMLIPSALLCIVRRKKYIVRIGGDHLWETYIARTKEQTKLSSFYSPTPTPSFKEKIIFFLTRMSVRYAVASVFNTTWQRDIWEKPYSLKKSKTYVVENALVTRVVPYAWNSSIQKIIRCPVRDSEFKNVTILKKVWDTISQKYPDTIISFDYINLQERALILSKSYAVIQPSISDVAPNLICETVASGCPFICTQDTGIKSLIPSDVGMYVDTSNEKEIQQAIENILKADIHAQLVQDIKNLSVARTYNVLAKEYDYIWNKI